MPPNVPDPRAAADAAERKQLLVLGAAVASHALIAAGKLGLHLVADQQAVISTAFNYAEAFVAEAERRYGKIPT